MKVMVRKTAQGMSIYVPKKDLETAVLSAEKPALWGGTVTLANGWTLALPDLPAETRLPITVEATKVAEAA